MVWLQQYLMRALPSMAKLVAETGNHAKAIAALDQSAFVSVPSVAQLLEQPQWWSYVDVAALTP